MGFVESVKDMFFGVDEEEYYEDEMNYEYEDEQPEEAPRSGSFFSSKRSSKVVPIGNQGIQTRIMVLKPKCFNASTEVADELRKRRPVIVDVGALDPDEARRVIDFISGTVYGIDGNMQKITSGIFVATPSHIDIMGEIIAEDGANKWNII